MAKLDTTASLLRSQAASLLDSPKHKTCTHRDGCLFYVVNGFVRPFAIGYLLRALAGLQRGFRNIRKNPSGAVQEVLFSKNNVAFGTTLGHFGGLFKVLSNTQDFTILGI